MVLFSVCEATVFLAHAQTQTGTAQAGWKTGTSAGAMFRRRSTRVFSFQEPGF